MTPGEVAKIAELLAQGSQASAPLRMRLVTLSKEKKVKRYENGQLKSESFFNLPNSRTHLKNPEFMHVHLRRIQI